MHRRLVLALVAFCVVLSAQASYAGPRIRGRLVKVFPARRMVIFERPDGKQLPAILEKDAVLKRLGVAATLSAFRAGDLVVVEIAGPLNDTPLDACALMDIHSAGMAPSAQGSPPQATVAGTFATVGGPGAPMPVTAPNTTGIGLGGGQNVPGVGDYTTPNTNPGYTQRPPLVQPDVVPFGPGAHSQTVQIPPAFPALPSGNAPMTASPSPAGSPWLGQVLMQGGGAANPNSMSPPPQPAPIPMPVQAQMGTPPVQPQMAMPPAAPTQPLIRSLPPSQLSATPAAARPTSPTSLITGEEPPEGEAEGPARSSFGPEVVELQGNVTTVTPVRRMFYLQCMAGGRAVIVPVTVPAQLLMVSARTQAPAAFETLRVGDFVILSGLQTGGVVEARKLVVNP